MKTLQEIKDEYATERDCKNWSNMIHIYGGVTTSVVNELAKRYAEEALKEAAWRMDDSFDAYPKKYILNIIKELK